MKKRSFKKRKEFNVFILLLMIVWLGVSVITQLNISLVKAQSTQDNMQLEIINNNTENLFKYLGDKIDSAMNDYNAGNISKEEYANIMEEIKLLLDNKENYKKMKEDEVLVKNNIACPYSSSCTNGGGEQETYLYFNKVTGEEIWLCVNHPFKCNTASKLATQASEKTSSLYNRYVLWQGNGDAFRHAYWSALMTKHIDRDFAYDAGLAHEGLKRGYNFSSQSEDSKMDISNNYSGRILGDENKTKSDNQIANIIKNETTKGNLKRIRTYTSVPGYVDCYIDGIPTKYVGYYEPTSAGGLKS